MGHRDKIKIMHIIAGLGGGGRERRMLELVKEKEILLKQEMKFKEIYVFKRDERFMPKKEDEKNDNETQEIKETENIENKKNDSEINNMSDNKKENN